MLDHIIHPNDEERGQPMDIQSDNEPTATNPIPDPSAVAFAVEGPAYSSESETHVAYCPQSLYLVGTDGVIAAVLAPDGLCPKSYAKAVWPVAGSVSVG